jgi:hypothetical protein
MRLQTTTAIFVPDQQRRASCLAGMMKQTVAAHRRNVFVPEWAEEAIERTLQRAVPESLSDHPRCGAELAQDCHETSGVFATE